MSKNRINPEKGWVNANNRPRGPNGRQLCRRCSVEVPKGKISFCSDVCVHEWKIRTQPQYVREQLLKRDRGICAVCTLDTQTIEKSPKYVDWEPQDSYDNRFLAYRTDQSLKMA